MSDSCVGDFWDGWLKLMRLGIRRDGRDGVGRTMRRAFDDVRIYWGDVEDGWGGIVWLDGHSGCCRARILGHIEAVRCRLIVAFYQGRDGISVVTSGEVYPSGQETSSGPREPRSITHTGVF